MSRRAPRTIRIGTLGETEVAADFERLGWGAIFNSRHDIGTDLLLSARTEQGVDLGLLVGAQVKTGRSFFASPTQPKRGEPEGWWFRDKSRKHVDSWAGHVLPHLIVLRDQEASCSYWAHVTQEAIKSTGRGAKVLIPKANRVDEANRGALVQVARSIGGSTSSWEQSAWEGMTPPATDAFRYALIAPRLLAPHPNLGFGEPITPEQGVALLVQGRARNYEAFAGRHESVPDLNGARVHANWKWRFVGALAHRILNEDPSALLDLINEAPDAGCRSAVTVAAACALLDKDRPDDALHLLETTISAGQMSPVDDAWLVVQRAQLCMEVGRIDEAREAALEVQKVRAKAPSDATAGALAGAAAALLFNVSPWESAELKNAISSGDTVVTWWRSQTVRRGLDALVERSFKEWARTRGVTIAAEDTVAVQLISASMLANHAADHGGWRHLAALAGEATLLELDRHADPNDVALGVASLIRAGNSDAVKHAVRHLVADGPAVALSQVAKDLRFEQATRTTAFAELTFLEHAGGVLERGVADEATRFLLDCIHKPPKYRAFVKRTSPTYLVDVQLVESLAGVVPAASRRLQRSVARRITELPSQRQQIVAMAWRKVVLALPPDAWSEKVARQAKPPARRHESSLQLALLGVAAPYDEGAKRSLRERAHRGSLGAVVSLGNISSLPPSVVNAQVEKVAEAVTDQVLEARQGTWGMPAYDLGEALVLFNFWHPNSARWGPLLELLAEPRASAEQKIGALTALANSPKEIPVAIWPELGKTALAIASGELVRGPSLFEPGDQLTGRATILAMELGAIDLEDSPDPYLDLLTGEYRQRIWAANIAARLGRLPDFGVLVALTDDAHPAVRAAAAAGLAYHAASGDGGELVLSALRRSISDPGMLAPRAVARQLAAVDVRGPASEAMLRELSAHSVAEVAEAAQGKEL